MGIVDLPEIYPVFDSWVLYTNSYCAAIQDPPIYARADASIPRLWAGDVSPRPVTAWNSRRAYMEFYPPTLPQRFIVTGMRLSLLPISPNPIAIKQIGSDLTTWHELSSAQELYTAITNGGNYATPTLGYVRQEVDLGPQAVADYLSHPTWFALGFQLATVYAYYSQFEMWSVDKGVVSGTDYRPWLIISGHRSHYGG